MSDKARRALTDYYAYMNRESNNFASETITGKMVKGNVGGGNPGSTIPKGIKFTDPEFLKWIDRMDFIVGTLEKENRGAFEFIMYHYSEGLKYKEICDITKYSPSTCKRLHNEALEIINVRM